MFAALKENMDKQNYNAFICDYELLYHNKQCTSWNIVNSLKNTTFICAKDLFDKLQDKYNYLAYKYIVFNNPQVTALTQSVLKTKGIYPAFTIQIHFLTEIYISFMIEWIFKQELKKNNIKIIWNDYLDKVQKIDLLIENKAVQIKNYSFISSNENTSKRMFIYRKIKDLYFIFYTLEQDNIYFAEIDNKILLEVSDIDDFTVFKGKHNITLKETIEKIKAAAC